MMNSIRYLPNNKISEMNINATMSKLKIYWSEGTWEQDVKVDLDVTMG
ncbi:hypothetical protein HU830_05580 [Lactobacillus sp. DCY120]|uniref:Uncharacterized protein n=1 Tax=Bombilactobacillus apium TaxID=2675299 RepID=A0A850R7I2_9LACO|nr:hypothetical protein [Bombilactobacillus apium]NVY96632.1 hypothetical protein [Bombilactobacillus apium]